MMITVKKETDHRSTGHAHTQGYKKSVVSQEGVTPCRGPGKRSFTKLGFILTENQSFTKMIPVHNFILLSGGNYCSFVNLVFQQKPN